MSLQKVLVTREGLTELKRELDELVQSKRPEAVTRLANARGQGDLTENSEYTAAKQDLAFIDGRIAELKLILTEAKVIGSHSKKKISHSSPLGKALLGKKPGEKVEVEAPAGKILYKIVNIE